MNTAGEKTNLHATPCGTFAYAAPEVVSQRMPGYLPFPVDLWSAGVCLFAMLTCEFPFTEPSEACAEFRSLISGNFRWPNHASDASIHLMGRLLTVNPEYRVRIEEALDHPWCQEGPNAAQDPQLDPTYWDFIVDTGPSHPLY